ncbi:MAG: biotin--[acetyl-CoA-carboxylase] ligase [Salinirussus sp.]
MQETRRQVLDAIADGPVAGPDLAAALDVSRAAVWKHVEALREAGFDIDADDGYRLVGTPSFGATAVEYGLDAPFEVEFHETIGSTNDRARHLARADRTDIVVLADEQTGGRGRLAREWASPSGGVWLSILLRPAVGPARAPLFTLAAAVATTRAARRAGVDASIKWPNDVLAGDREAKLAGILTEMGGETGRLDWLVVGIGVNADVDPAAVSTDRPATSLRAELDGGDVDRRTFTRNLLEAFHALRSEPAAILSAWRTHASTPGRQVRIETPDGPVTGRAVDVVPPGSLVVETDSGRERVSAGDCEHLRPVSNNT